MYSVINTKLGENRGLPRVWLEGKNLSPSFKIGEPIEVKYDRQRKVVHLRRVKQSGLSVSKRTKPNGVVPLIEVKDQELATLFGAPGVKLRVVLKQGKARIELHGIEVAQRNRIKRFVDKLKSDGIFKTASLFSGGGILDAAMHEGLERAGIKSKLAVFVEKEQRYMDAMIENQPELFDDDTIAIQGSIEDVEYHCNGSSMFVDFAWLGIPCVGASKAGKTKNKIGAAEFHSSAGALFFYALEFILRTQPVLLLIENVKEYLSTTSMEVIRSVLSLRGYELQERVFNGVEFGTLENRDRMVLVAVTKGLDGFDLNSIVPVQTKPSCVADILEDVALDDESWRTYDYLAAKELRDKAANKGFKRTLLKGEETSVPVIRRLYNKGGSCDPFVVHPVDSDLSRKLTPTEHALCKWVPLRLIKNLAVTTAHEILGQSICYSVFTAIAEQLGDWLREVVKVKDFDYAIAA